jgi:hypothetical protein
MQRADALATSMKRLLAISGATMHSVARIRAMAHLSFIAAPLQFKMLCGVKVWVRQPGLFTVRGCDDEVQ